MSKCTFWVRNHEIDSPSHDSSCRELKEFNSLCRIAKLFAKHFKIEEQEAFLRKEQARIVVGTPNRLEKLIDTGMCG